MGRRDFVQKSIELIVNRVVSSSLRYALLVLCVVDFVIDPRLNLNRDNNEDILREGCLATRSQAESIFDDYGKAFAKSREEVLDPWDLASGSKCLFRTQISYENEIKKINSYRVDRMGDAHYVHLLGKNRLLDTWASVNIIIPGYLDQPVGQRRVCVLTNQYIDIDNVVNYKESQLSKEEIRDILEDYGNKIVDYIKDNYGLETSFLNVSGSGVWILFTLDKGVLATEVNLEKWKTVQRFLGSKIQKAIVAV